MPHTHKQLCFIQFASLVLALAAVAAVVVEICEFLKSVKFEMAIRKKRMSSDEIVHLLGLYREHELLWNYSHELYKNKQKRLAALETIRAAMDLESVDEVKRRIKVVRDTYNIEKNKMSSSKKSGAGTADVYHTRLSWYKTAHEFLSVCEARESYSNIVSTYILFTVPENFCSSCLETSGIQ